MADKYRVYLVRLDPEISASLDLNPAEDFRFYTSFKTHDEALDFMRENPLPPGLMWKVETFGWIARWEKRQAELEAMRNLIKWAEEGCKNA